MNYISVRWLHEFPNDPVVWFSELDNEGWETRKVEVFADGSKGYASGGEEIGGTGLAQIPMPPLAEIAADPQFVPCKITQEEFEEVWRTRTDFIHQDES